MNQSEAQTRKNIIDKQLLEAGWNINIPTHVTTELDIWLGKGKASEETNETYNGHLFADYALLGKDGKPLAVVEAKRTSVAAEIGKEQARKYAEQIQRLNGGHMPFVFYTNGYDIFFWDTNRYPPRKIYGFPSRADLERMLFFSLNSKPMSTELINTAISGRPYQIEAVRSMLEAVEKKKRKFLLVMATGTGKTRTCMALIDVLMRSNWVQRVLFLVDRIALREQALEAFKDHLPNAPIWPKQGETEFASDRRVYVATYPAMLNIIEEESCPITPHYFDLIIADESHRSVYNIYKNIFDYFDALQLGLTATPKDCIDHNTFQLFNCDDGLPTFAYTYEEAVNNIPPYLSDFEVIKIRTRFQQEGINSSTIAEIDKKMLISEGKNPDEISFEGTELEKKVSNKGTNVLIAREFMEESIKDSNGVLPGKSIFFALSKKHAYRLCEVFDSLYPEYMGKLAEVIISDVKGVHGKGGILDRFKNSDMPRIAISVDMLDTGIDVREVVNLVFAKPVFSYTKFWQMIGRGTRVLDPTKIRSWCPQKDKFLIMDCWDNFEYFKMNPKGKEAKPTIPLPVRLFTARLDKLAAALEANDNEIINKVISDIRYDIDTLPQNSVVVHDSRQYLDPVKDDAYWKNISPEKIGNLRSNILPVMRIKSDSDFKAMRFELDIVELSIAKLRNEKEHYESLKEGVLETVKKLPLTINIVAKEKDFIDKVLSQSFWTICADDNYDQLVVRLAPLMKYIDTTPLTETTLNLLDLLTVKDYIEFGPEHERITVDKYRLKVEETIHTLVKTSKPLQKLLIGEELTELEIESLADILKNCHPNITEQNLRECYDNKQAKFIQFIKHILGIESLATFTETVSFAFEEFIREHNNYSQQQITFLLTLKSFILQRGSVEKKDLIHDPFTQIHPQGIRGIFSPQEINEIVKLIQGLAA